MGAQLYQESSKPYQLFMLMHFQIIKWSPSTHLVTWFEALWGGLSLLMISEVEGFWGDPGGWEREVEGTFWGPSQGVGGYLSDRWPQCGGCRGDWCPWWCCTLHEGHNFLRRLLMLMSAISVKFICQNFMLMKNTTYIRTEKRKPVKLNEILLCHAYWNYKLKFNIKHVINFL